MFNKIAFYLSILSLISKCLPARAWQKIMNSDNANFLELCMLFENLDSITRDANFKRINVSKDEESSLFLTKSMKIKIHNVVSKWFSHFKTGNLCSLFRLLVPEV